MKIIKGNSRPKAEEKNFYEVTSLIPDFNNVPFLKKEDEKLVWTLFKNVKNNWQKVQNNIKYGKKVPYTFGEKVVGIPYKIEVHSTEKNIFSQNETKLVASLTVTPSTAKEPTIGKVILLNRQNSNVNVAKFNESLSAEARTANLFGKEITFYLWEEGTKEEDKYKKPKKAKVDKNGIAKVKFNLSEYASSKTFMDFFMGDSNSTKKFFVTAQYQNKTVSNKGYVEVSNASASNTTTAPKTTPPESTVYSIIQNTTEVVAEGLDKLGDYIMDKVRSATQVNPQASAKEDGKCPNCEKDITLEQIKAICVSNKNKKGTEICLVEDDTMITKALPFLNQFRKKVGINTCITKAHFLAQISHESKFFELQERFKYSSASRMNGIFASYFKQFGKDRMREAERLSELSLKRENWPEVANAIYGKTHPLGKKHVNADDGWRYSGKGFKQITWKDNYADLQSYTNKLFGKNYIWLDGNNPYKLKNNPEDAITSALGFWGKHNITGVATEISNAAVKSVTQLINPALDGLSERERFFKKAVEILKVEQCKPKGDLKVSDEKGTVVWVSGTDKELKNDPARANLQWMMYKTSVYRDMSLATFKKLKNSNKLPEADYETYLSRDTHQVANSKNTEIYKHSDKRFGKYNEIPPGDYFLVPGLPGQKYLIYVIDSESKEASSENGIDGPDGSRGGVALHHYCPRFSVGCFTFNSGKNTQPVKDFISEIPDLTLGDSRPVHFVLDPREVVETTWDNPDYGTKKWKGI